MTELRVAVESTFTGRPTQRIYLDGHEIRGVRRVRVRSERGARTASLDLDVDAVSIDPRAVSRMTVTGGGDDADIICEADTLDGPITADNVPGWACGRARAYHRPDAFDRARDLCLRLVHVDWMVLVGVTFLIVTVVGVIAEDAILAYAHTVRRQGEAD